MKHLDQYGKEIDMSTRCGAIIPGAFIGGEPLRCLRVKGHEKKWVIENGKRKRDLLHWPAPIATDEQELKEAC